MNINQVSSVINRVLNQYQVKVDAAYGVDTPAFAMILTTEIFKESAGVNKPTPARKPAPKPTEQKPVEEQKPTIKPVKEKTA